MSSEKYIAGGKQLDDLLKTLAPKLEQNVLRSALRAGAVVYRNKARQNVPIVEGALKKSIRVTTNTRRGVVRAAVKAGGAVAPHALQVEYGTRPHKIKAAEGHALKFGEHVVAEIDHPGAEPAPYMRPAADEGHDEAIAAVVAKIRQRLTVEGLNVPAPEDL